MKRHTKMIRQGALFALMLASVAVTLNAQQQQQQPVNTSYKGTARDPFVAWRPAPKKPVKKGPTVIAPPPIQARIDAYKAQKASAMNMQQPAPKPTTALLLSEMQLTGVFRTPRGYAAMVEATPIKLSFVVYPGERFFDGMLVAIEESRLVCRKETRWSDGRREQGVEFKPLGQPNAVKDSMTAANAAAPAPAQAAAEPAAANEANAAPADTTPQLKAQPGLQAGNPNKPERKGVWGLLDKHGKEIAEQGAKCPGGRAFVTLDGTVTCRE